MDKEKILDHLESACNFLDCSTCDVLDFTDMTDEIDKAIRELNSKVKMPKVFDEWAKRFDLNDYESLNDALKMVADIYFNFDEMELRGSDYKLSFWIHDPVNDFPDEERYSQCIDALVNGYEVE